MSTEMHGAAPGMETLSNADGQGRRRWRTVAWSAVAAVLLLPLVATLFTDDVNWSAADFLFAGVVLVSVGVAFELVVRKTTDTVYRAAMAVALAGALLLVWANGAVGITDSAADGLYLGVIAVGFVGAVLARFRASGMARALIAMAFAQTLVAIVALAAGMVPAHNSAFEVMGITAFFVALFAGSALLFRKAARAERA